MNSKVLIEAKKILNRPGLYEIEDARRLFNLGIALATQIEDTICRNADIGIRRLFHNINELRDLYNKEHNKYVVYLKVADYNEIIEESLNAISETLHGLLRLAFFYFAREAAYYVNEYKEHCKEMFRAINDLPHYEFDFTKYALPEENTISQADYYRILLYTGIIDGLRQKKDIETAELINPEELNKNTRILSMYDMEYFFLYYRVHNFNLSTARTTIEKMRNKKITVENFTKKQLATIMEIIAKLNKEQ